MGRQDVAIVIPVRLESRRFPGKALAPLAGKTVLGHVVACAEAAGVGHVWVATDSPEVAEVLGDSCPLWLSERPFDCGCDRVAAAAAFLPAEVRWVINLQADEPCLPMAALEAMIATLTETPAEVDMVSACVPMWDWQMWRAEDRVKVVLGAAWAGSDLRRGLYFSRSPVPFGAERSGVAWHLHLGLYGFRRERLRDFAALAPEGLALVEDLEQLRALAWGWRLGMVVLSQWAGRGWPAIDRPEDLALAACCLEQRSVAAVASQGRV